MYAYLTAVNGARAGVNFVLDTDHENRIGRGLECQVVLTDPLSSRVHAVVQFQPEDGWWLRDHRSRNGTYINGQKVDEARLAEGSELRIGSSEFQFHESEERPAETSMWPTNLAQTIVRDTPIDPGQIGEFGLSALQDPERGQDFLVLYQLSIKLLGCYDPDRVVRISLDLLLERTRASLVGFLWVSDDGRLVSKLVLPETSGAKVNLSESLTELVLRKSRAVWVDNHSAPGTTESLTHFADAICVPLIHDKSTLGAVHLYLDHGRFKQSDYEFSISLARILVVALARARQQAMLQAKHERLIAKTGDFDELVGESKPMRDLKSKIARVARATGCVLIRGESGSGKELVARATHRTSARSDRPMLSVNCAAIPRELVESQLFGHKKGAFTSADADHVGWFQQADSGTLFLDEVGELTLEGQAKLLRILEGHPFLPVGGTEEINVDVRVIAATNRDLRDFVRDKRFREDLYYRLSVFELYVPPLRERGGDIETLVAFFLDHFKLQHGRPQLELSAAARSKLLGYSWPGNVRQLRNVIDSAVVMAELQTIEPGDLGLRDAGGEDVLQSLRLDDWERRLIKEALGRTSNSVPEAAKLLGIGRATLYRKIDEYAIER